jgi:hypothetical protein
VTKGDIEGVFRMLEQHFDPNTMLDKDALMLKFLESYEGPEQ